MSRPATSGGPAIGGLRRYRDTPARRYFDRERSPLFFPQPFAPILNVPAQAGYGDKWPS